MKILKRLVTLLMTAAMLLSTMPVVFAGVEYSVEDAYYECAEIYPEFVDKLKAEGVSDRQIISFLTTVQKYLLNLDEPVTEANFEDNLIDAVLYGFTLRVHVKIRDGLQSAFPEAAVDGAYGVIHPDFVPILETVKKIIFEHGMLGDDTATDKKEETVPTEPESVVPTESTEPTEPKSEVPTENTQPTEKPTEPKTEPPTENKGGSAGSSAGNVTGGSAPDANNTNQQGGDDIQTPTDIVFSDMNQAQWAQEAVSALVKRQIISGYPDGTFKPNNSISRAEFAKIIVLASGRYNKNAKCSFKDVKETDWFYSYVACAKELGFITGRSEEIFDPGSNITRADLCTIVYRFIKSINSEFSANKIAAFKDGDSIPSYALDAVNSLYNAGIADGMGDNKFEPLVSATRAQSAKIIYGALTKALGF